MLKPRMTLLCLAALGAAACASQSSFLKSKEPVAVQTALARGQFDLNCPTAVPSVLSEDSSSPRWKGGGRRPG